MPDQAHEPLLLDERLTLDPSPEQANELRFLLEQVNQARNHVSRTAFRERRFSFKTLHYLVYRDLRLMGLNSRVAQLAIKSVSACYSGKTPAERANRRSKQVCFKPHAAIQLDGRGCLSYKRDDAVSLWTFSERGREHIPYTCRPGVLPNAKHGAKLCYDGRRFYLMQSIERAATRPAQPGGWLGVDRGIVVPAADSDGQDYGRQARYLRRHEKKLRARLQAKATKSAKRLLKRRRRKEQRRERDLNHCISKQLVARARDTGRGLALEDLSGDGLRDSIKVLPKRTRAQREMRDELSSWSHAQLFAFVLYKARLAGVPVQTVDPAYTSQTCPECGYVRRENRISRSWFRCVSCGCAGRADTIAARNIAGRAMASSPDADSSLGWRAASA